MITGVKHGYEYKMKMVYAHFPINVACDKAPGSKVSNKIEIRNFLGEKVVRSIIMQPGVEVVRTSEKVGSPPPFTSFHPSSNPTPFLPFLPFLLSLPSLPLPLPTNTPSTPPWRCITQFCCTHCATCSPQSLDVADGAPLPTCFRMRSCSRATASRLSVSPSRRSSSSAVSRAPS